MKGFFSKIFGQFDILQFIKYGCIGALNTVVDFAVFWILACLLKLPVIPSQVISFLVSTVNSFLWNRRWTFSRSGHTNTREVLRYCLGKALYLLFNLLLLKLLIPLVAAIPAFSALREDQIALISKVPTAAILILFNYFYDKLNVFRDK